MQYRDADKFICTNLVNESLLPFVWALLYLFIFTEILAVLDNIRLHILNVKYSAINALL